jgi:hypothetical protein
VLEPFETLTSWYKALMRSIGWWLEPWRHDIPPVR